MNDGHKQFGFHVWANNRVFARLEELPQSVLYEPIQSVFPSIGETLAHMVAVDNVWFLAIAGRTVEIMEAVQQVRAEAQGADLARLRSLFAVVTAKFQDFLASLPDWSVEMDYVHPQYGTLRASYFDIMAHVVNHGTYHRGNIAAMLRQLGHPGVATDYVFYLYDVAASR